jgi:hypothetical protein
MPIAQNLPSPLGQPEASLGRFLWSSYGNGAIFGRRQHNQSYLATNYDWVCLVFLAGLMKASKQINSPGTCMVPLTHSRLTLQLLDLMYGVQV